MGRSSSVPLRVGMNSTIGLWAMMSLRPDRAAGAGLTGRPGAGLRAGSTSHIPVRLQNTSGWHASVATVRGSRLRAGVRMIEQQHAKVLAEEGCGEG